MIQIDKSLNVGKSVPVSSRSQVIVCDISYHYSTVVDPLADLTIRKQGNLVLIPDFYAGGAIKAEHGP